ncbi:MAG: hypothetical protein ACOYNL_08515 [Rickettsiales bacterium]
MKHARHWCPVCDQGWVEHVIITPPTKRGWLCAECEAFWLKKPLKEETFVQFSAWMKGQGIDKRAVNIQRK